MCDRFTTSLLEISTSSLWYADFMGEAVVVNFLKCCCNTYLHWLGPCSQILLARMLHCQVLCSLGTAQPALCVDILHWDWHLEHLFPGIAALSHCRMPWLNSFWWQLLHYHIHFCSCCYMSTHFSVMWGFSMGHTSLQSVVRIFLCSSLYLKMIEILFYYQRLVFQSV